MIELVVATSNPHKVDEIRAVFANELGDGVRLLGLKDLGISTREPDEIGSTFEANATIKALSYAEQTGAMCLADDSGLEIDALGGRPGVISSHYCTDGRETGLPRPERDLMNNERVLRELAGVPEAARTARFVCVMVLAAPTPGRTPAGPPEQEQILHLSRGHFEGRIGIPPTVPRGANGFGYDPLFLVAAPPYGFALSSAELSSDEKNRLSHRGAAARDMARFLRVRLDHA